MGLKNSVLESDSFLKLIWNRLVVIWDSIISIGLTPHLSDWDRRRIRLLDGISAMAVLILSFYSINYLSKSDWVQFVLSFQGFLAYVTILLLIYFRKYSFAFHFFNLYNISYFLFNAITQGSLNASEYLLVPSSIASMLLFRDKRIVVFYFMLNGLSFAICKYSFTVLKPIILLPVGSGLYIANHVTMFVTSFLIVLYFKSENFRQEKLLETQNKSLALEQQKSDNLLLNILPRETAEELKSTGSAQSRQFDAVTILFSDFKNFTLASEKMSPDQLVTEIHQYFSYFDSIMEKFGIEKIKTIGDAYMCAGGIPDENATHAVDVVKAAFEMQHYVEKVKLEKLAAGKIFFEIRIGIHTGPVVAGIVGTKKFAYDIWGDTVNLASRMESSGEVGRVNISATTYELVKDQFQCEYRGKIAAKNKGDIDMYFVVQ